MAKKSEPNSIVDMFTMLGRELKMPRMDVESIIDHNRRNLEALQKAMAASASGASDMMTRQREMMEDAFQEVSEMAHSLRDSKNPQDVVSKQTEFARKSFETAVRNAGEMAEIAKKSGSESIDVLRKRIRDSIEEVRSDFERRK